MRRLPPAARQEPAPWVHFFFDGQQYEGREGEPLAFSLWAQGVRLLGWQEGSGAGRGLYCGIGHCFECRVRVDGLQDVRACLTPLREGLRAERQPPPAAPDSLEEPADV